VRRFATAASLLLAFAQSATSASAEDPSALFREALRQDLMGGSTGARLAFDMYRRAAEAGLPEAQFNVAIMLDSGRGVSPDVAQPPHGTRVRPLMAFEERHIISASFTRQARAFRKTSISPVRGSKHPISRLLARA